MFHCTTDANVSTILSAKDPKVANFQEVQLEQLNKRILVTNLVSVGVFSWKQIEAS